MCGKQQLGYWSLFPSHSDLTCDLAEGFWRVCTLHCALAAPVGLLTALPRVILPPRVLHRSIRRFSSLQGAMAAHPPPRCSGSLLRQPTRRLCQWTKLQLLIAAHELLLQLKQAQTTDPAAAAPCHPLWGRRRGLQIRGMAGSGGAAIPGRLAGHEDAYEGLVSSHCCCSHGNVTMNAVETACMFCMPAGTYRSNFSTVCCCSLAGALLTCHAAVLLASEPFHGCFSRKCPCRPNKPAVSIHVRSRLADPGSSRAAQHG